MENEKLEELFGKHFNGMHYEDITKERVMAYAKECTEAEVKKEKEAIRLKIDKLEKENEWLKFMVDNGLGEEDLRNDITMPKDI